MFPWNLFPFKKDTLNMMKQLKPEEIEKYVKDMMSQMMPGNMQGMPGNMQGMDPGNFSSFFNPQANHHQQKNSALNSSVFETHHYVFVRIPIKNEQWLKDLRIFHTSNQLIVEHVPEYEDKHTIVLPALVRKKGASANFKDDTLEIRIPKNTDMQYTEIDVNEI